jgi:predicted nucleotidyltransferase
MDTAGRLREPIAEVMARHPVAYAYLFGSVARGEDRPDSDVDVAVRFEPGLTASERFSLLLRIGTELEVALHRPVDVVDLAEANLRLAGRIITERVVVTGMDRPERVRFEVDLLPRYLDFEYHARRLDQLLLQAMADGER